MQDDLNALATDAQYMDVHKVSAKYRQFSLSQRQKRFFKFAFVRNPFDRLVSCYKDKVKKEVQHTGRYYFATSYNDVLLRRLFGDKFRCDMTFEQFVQLVSKIPDFLADGHFRSQYSILYNYGRQIPDFIGKSERILEDWQHIADRYELETLGAQNRTRRDDWRQYYRSDEIVNTVARRYARDVELFDYTEVYRKLLAHVRSATG